MKIAVVGAGICGLSAARSLAARGHDVVLHEQFDLFHNKGSSHGETRIIRRAYPDPFYTACMVEAYPMWHELEVASGRKLVSECGLLYFGKSESQNLRTMAEALQSLSVPHEIADRRRARDLMPDLHLETDEAAVWTPAAGWVDAAGALRAIYDLACSAGLDVRTGSRADPFGLAKENDAVVVAAGAWTPTFVPIPVRVTLQTFAYVDAQIGGPVWIEDSPDLAYGFPSTKSGLKAGIHRSGPRIDPDLASREPQSTFLDAIRDVAARRLGIADPQLVSPTTCLYTSTATEDFLLGRLAPNVFFASACSGHGFKMGPWIGRLLAGFAEGKDEPERHPRFFFDPASVP